VNFPLTLAGVGFRYFHSVPWWGGGAYFLTREQVEGEVQGEDDVLQDFLKDIDKGPRHAHVVKLEKSEIEVQEAESGFEVRH
jgi:acylphosphatase